MAKVAVIGGSGVYNLDKVQISNEQEIETPYGKPSAKISTLNIDGHECFFIPRHGIGHHISPSEINYRANIYALKSLGVDTVISVSAVGSLKEEYAPTHFVIPDQFIDWTKGKRERTFFEEGVVGHVSNAYPINQDLQMRILGTLADTDIKYHAGGTYICIEGPQFSTRAESLLYRQFGCDVIGMTNVPEAFLAKEAGMAYATVAMVTDYDCWKEEHCTVEEIMKVMGENYKSAQTLIEKIVPNLATDPINVVKENTFAVVTNPELLTEEQKKINSVLQS